MLLTRQQYDALLERFPLWMHYVWPTLQKVWGVGGVYVYIPDHPGIAHELRINLKTIGWTP